MNSNHRAELDREQDLLGVVEGEAREAACTMSQKNAKCGWDSRSRTSRPVPHSTVRGLRRPYHSAVNFSYSEDAGHFVPLDTLRRTCPVLSSDQFYLK